MKVSEIIGIGIGFGIGIVFKKCILSYSIPIPIAIPIPRRSEDVVNGRYLTTKNTKRTKVTK